MDTVNLGTGLKAIETSFRHRMPKTKDELDAYLRAFYGFFLASVPIEDGNSCPLDFAWDIYSVAMGLKSDISLEDYNLLGMSTRSGQKSLTCAAIELLMITFDHDRDYFHMASIFDQSKVTYGYVQSVLDQPEMSNFIKSTTLKETRAASGRVLKIGTGTIKSVNSYHGSTIQDEVDLTDHRVFTESKGMLSPGKNGKSPLDIKISSRKFAFGNIQSLVDKKEQNPDYPLKIHKWSIMEMMQRCPTERSLGEKKTDTIYVDENNLHAISGMDYAQIQDLKKKEQYGPMGAYPGCLKCGIFSFCKGQAKKQVTDNPYLISIDDIKRWFLTDDLEFFKSQRLNRKPSSLGLIYGVWDPQKHLQSYENMFFIFTGREWGSAEGEMGDLSLALLISYFLQHGCRLFMGLDFGFNVAAAVLIVKDGSDRFYIIDELVVENNSDADFALACWNRWKYPVTLGLGDVASPGAIREFSKYFNMLESIVAGQKDLMYTEYAKLSKDYSYRFGLVRKLLAAPGTKEPRLFVAPQCQTLVVTMGLYRAKFNPAGVPMSDVPADNQNDHVIDSMGHGLVGIVIAGNYAAKAVVVTNAETFVGGTDIISGSPHEIAEHLGINPATANTKVPPRSLPTDPVTGLPLDNKKDDFTLEIKPRETKSFRYVMVEE